MADIKKESRFLKNIHPLLRRSKREDKPSNDSNYAVITAIDEALRDVEDESKMSKLYASLAESPGEYLDVYGGYFDVRRKESEKDEDYRKRIIEKIDIPRGTNYALEFATKRYLGNPNLEMNIHEYWQEVFYINRSYLNGFHNMLGNVYNVAVIDIKIGSPFPIGLVEELDKFKPAGVTMFLTYDPSLSSGDVPGSRVVPYMEYNLEHATLALGEQGLNKFYRGSLKLSDKVIHTDNGLFILNESHLNSLRQLGRVFDTYNSTTNALGIGFNTIRPQQNDYVEHLYAQQRPIDLETYHRLDTFGKDSIPVELNASQALYFTYNLEQHARTKYGKVDYNLLNQSEFVVRTKESRDRVQYTIEVFNFATGKWEPQYQGFSKTSYSVKVITLDQAEEYINLNGVLTLRMVPMARLTLDVDYVSLDYKYEVEYLTSHNYGYTADSRSHSIKYPPVITNYLFNGLNDTLKGEIKLTDKRSGLGFDTFRNNRSELNESDRLDSYYTFNLGYYNALSTMERKEELLKVIQDKQATIEDIHGVQEVAPGDTLEEGGYPSVESSPERDIYFSFDIYEGLGDRYRGVLSKGELVHVLDNATFTFDSKENVEGVGYRLEVFNYAKEVWETKVDKKTSEETTAKDFEVTKGGDYVNSNGLLLTRLSSEEVVSHEIDNLAIQYTYELGKLLDYNYGYSAKSLPEVKLTWELLSDDVWSNLEGKSWRDLRKILNEED